jgi:peroxiredoxin Q/BCP
MKHLKIGDSAPTFKVKNQSDRMVELNQFKGKKLVIYFYPKDNTPGCTTQACNLRDNYTEFTDKGYEILGVSADSVAKHDKFIAKQNLPFDLLAD